MRSEQYTYCYITLTLCCASGVARFQQLLGHLVGVAMCYHKVNFDPSFETAQLAPGAHICCWSWRAKKLKIGIGSLFYMTISIYSNAVAVQVSWPSIILLIHQGTQKFTGAWARMGPGVGTPLYCTCVAHNRCTARAVCTLGGIVCMVFRSCSWSNG